MSAPWRLITTFGAPPNFNMGLDEALLELGERPTLRLYTWSPDTLSLGYFQKLTDVPERAQASHIVRRITGGGAIHHTGELTFSFTTGVSDHLYRGNVADSYVRIHRAVMHALAKVGIRAQLACGDAGAAVSGSLDAESSTGSAIVAPPNASAATSTCAASNPQPPVDSDQEGTGMCFHKSTPQDILWGNKKGVGSAQRRRNGRVLHHGSIKLATSKLEGNIATIGETDGTLTPQTFAPLLLDSFQATLGLQFERGVPNPVELEQAAILEPRYSSEEFLNRR
ncbi:MAG: lipoate--protein ligase family protein [Planctomycetes bacterium]|nr:lipoate--protein ligase family protein [Planctomycetota bacterium]